jgi:RNase P/RNase MRP subunit p29
LLADGLPDLLLLAELAHLLLRIVRAVDQDAGAIEGGIVDELPVLVVVLVVDDAK